MSTRYYERFQDVQDYLQPLREQSGLNIPDWYDHEIPPIGLHAEVTVKVFYIKVPVACLEQVDDTIAIKDNFKESIRRELRGIFNSFKIVSLEPDPSLIGGDKDHPVRVTVEVISNTLDTIRQVGNPLCMGEWNDITTQLLANNLI